LLKVRGVTKRFGGLRVLEGIDMDVSAGEFVGLIGPNGAGKTTLFNVLTGMLPLNSGTVAFLGRNITNWPANRVFLSGIARTFQVVRPFYSLSCRDNVLVAYKAKFGNTGADEAATGALEFLGLGKKADKPASDLNLAEKRKLELARAMVAKPNLLMLDEVMAGLNASELDDMIDHIRRLKQGLTLTIIAVEHIMHVIMSLSDRILVLNQGKLIADGTPKQVAANEEVIRAYLGEDSDAAS
jgi:branched-chain amino acid transport system ATP-binding protein